MDKNQFAGSLTLTRFIFRRDRIRLVLWVVLLAGFIVMLAPVFENLLATEGGGMEVMGQLMKNPAMVAMVGPVYGADNYTSGAAFSNMMLLFSSIIAGIMSIFLICRHTRQDEELGRHEVVRSLPVGRLANLASALFVALIVNAVLALAVGFGLFAVRQEGMGLGGCLLFGSTMGITGLFFAAVAALFCQITANNRTATGASLLVMVALYMMRAIGDAGVGVDDLAVISPLGLILAGEVFVSNNLWPTVVLLVECAVIVLAAFALARVRDLGRGIVAERAGRRHASAMLSGPFGLAAKLLRTPLIIWSLTVFIFAGMYGSVFGELDTFIGENEMLQAIFMANPDMPIAEQFIVMLVAIMAMISTIPVLSFIHRVGAEERHGYAEHLFARSVSRLRQLSAYFVPALITSIMLQLLTALGFWAVGSAVLDTCPSLGTFLTATLSYLPAMWVLMGISVLLVAAKPDWAFLSYVYLGFGFFSVYLGAIMNLPDWLLRLTPYGYIGRYPVEDVSVSAMVVLCAVALAMCVVGFAGYKEREAQTQ